MAFKLVKTNTFLFPCALTQIDEDGKQHQGKLRVRFNKITRERWDEMTKSDDDRLLYDELVNAIEDDIDDGTGGTLSADAALASVRQDLSLTGQIVDQGLETLFGATAKNARRSRSR